VSDETAPAHLATGDRQPPERPSWPRRELRAFGEIFALWGLAIAQPLLDLFGRAPHQFVFRGAEGGDVLLFALGVVVVAPVALWLMGAVIGLVHPVVRTGLHVAVLGVLVWAFVVQVARPLVSEAPLVVLAVVAAAVGIVAYLRFAAVKVWLAFLAIAPVVFALLFLLASPTSRLISGDRVAALGAPIGSPAPVVMVVLDEFPTASLLSADGGVDRDVAPNLAALVDDAHWFRNATTPTTFTVHAVPSMATGLLPRHDTAPFAADHPENLFTLLGAGYDLNVVESITRLCPSNLCAVTETDRGRLVEDAVEVMRARLSYDGPQGDPIAGFVEPAADIPDDDDLPDHEVPGSERFDTFMDGINDDSLALHYLHVLLPHQPFRFVPSGRSYPLPAYEIGRGGDEWNDKTWPTRLGRQRHLLQVRYTDRMIGDLVDRLRDVGLYDDALIVLTSDHGIAFQPGGPIRLVSEQPLTDDVAPELMWVPLVMKLPGQEDGVVDDRNALITDILPTIADVLDMELPSPVDGRSLLGPERDDDDKPYRAAYVHEGGVGVRDETTFDGAAGFERLLDGHVERLLPPAGEPDRLWRIGPSSELLGTSADGMPLVDNELQDPVRDFDPASGVVEAVVRTYVEGVAEGDPVAVAVNGVIGATADVWIENDRPAVAVVVKDDLFEPGPNEITIHRLPG
jgi:hypothetical protein